MNRTHARGFTLIELMLAAGIMVVAVAMAGAVIMAGLRLTNTANQKGDANDQARIALNEIVHALQLAGNGAPGGVYVGKNPVLYGAVFGNDGTSGNGGTVVAPPNDDLWLMVPTSNALRESCKDDGAATTLMAPIKPGSQLLVGCAPAGLVSVGDMLLVSNMDTAALITVSGIPAVGNPATPIAGKIDYLEEGGSLGNVPAGFSQGDMAYKVRILHYYVKNDANGVPGLYRSQGSLTASAPAGTYPNGPYPTAGRPFIDADNGTLIQPNVDDLQLKFAFDLGGRGDPTSAQWTWADGLSPAIPAGSGGALAVNATTLRAVRVSVEVRTGQVTLNNRDATIKSDDTRHQIIENNYTAGTLPASDGFSRSVYTRTVELPNLSPGSM